MVRGPWSERPASRKRGIAVLATLLLSASCLLSSAFCTTVTGTLIDSTGNPIVNGKVAFLIENYGVGNIPRVQSSGIVVQTTPITGQANASGQFSVTLDGNDTITPAGTYYQATFYNGNAVYLQVNYLITGSTLNLNTATPLNAIPAVPPAQAYTTVEQAGSPLQQRQILNFLSGITCADDPTNSSTDCTGNGGPGNGPTLETNGVQNGSQTVLNLLNGTDIRAANSGGAVTFSFTGVLPATQSATAHEWLNSYNATTGAFTATQPALSDVSLPSETANYVWAAPNGSNGTPSFRAIVPADIPTLNQNTTGNAATASALALTPAQCSGAQFATGIVASGAANCAQPAFSGISGMVSNSQLANSATTVNGQTCTLGSTCNVNSGAAQYTLAVNEGAGAAMDAVSSGNAGQVLISNGSGAKPSFQDPIVSYAYVNLLNAASATATQTSSLTRVSTFSGFGTLYVTYASITGSPSGCTLQIKNSDSLGNLINNGSAISTTPANGTTTTAISSASGYQTTAQMEVVYACTTYPTAGTISVDYVPQITVSVANTPSVTVSGSLPSGSNTIGAVTQASGPWTVSQSGTWNVGLSSGSNTIGAVTQASGPWTENLTQVNGNSVSLGQTTMAASFPVTIASNQSAVPASESGTWNVGLSSGSNTIGAVTQASGPWTQNITQWDGTALGAPSNYGTSPGAVAVPGVNAYVTNTPTVSQSGTWTVQPGNTQNTTAWLTSDSGNGPVSAGTAASKSELAGCVYNSTLPSPTNGQQVAAQCDSSGRQLADVAVLPALPTGSNTIGAVTQASGPWTQNITQFGGNNVVTGTGASGSGIPRVTISNDSSLAANQSVNVNQIGGSSVYADPCQINTPSVANINLTANGQLITGTSGKQTYVCYMMYVTATAQNIALVEGTGTTCGTSTAGMNGGSTAATGQNWAANGGFSGGDGRAWIFKTATTGDNVCLLLSGSGQTSGVIKYVQQ